jgi:hypothetical protein
MTIRILTWILCAPPRILAKGAFWARFAVRHALVALLILEGLFFLAERCQFLPKGWPVLLSILAVGLSLVGLMLLFVVSLIVRWRFQFGIRSLFLLTVVVAIPSSWLAAEMKHAQPQARIITEIGRLGGRVGVGDGHVVFSAGMYPVDTLEPEWIRRILGHAFFRDDVRYVDFRDCTLNDAQFAEISQAAGIERVHGLDLTGTKITDQGLACLQRWHALEDLEMGSTATSDAGLRNLEGLTNLSILSLSNTDVTGATLDSLGGLQKLETLKIENVPMSIEGLQTIKGLRQLKSLTFGGSPITDASLRQVEGFTQLKVLDLSGSRVTDAGLYCLQSLAQLEALYLSTPQVSDAGLEHLRGLRNLKTLFLNGTKVTHSGILQLGESLPAAQIQRDGDLLAPKIRPY